MSKKNSLIDQILSERSRLWPVAASAQKLLSGLPAPSDALKSTTPVRLLLFDITWLAIFVGLAASGSFMAMQSTAWLAVGAIMAIVGSLGAIGRLRRIVVGHVHEATHGVSAAYYRERGIDAKRAAQIGETILDIGSALTFTLNGRAYRSAHQIHHDEALGTRNDPDGLDLYRSGLWPSLTSRPLVSLALRLVSPLYHGRAFAARLHTNLIAAAPLRRLMGAITLGLLIGSVLILPFWVWIVSVFFVWGPGYQAAALLQVMTEHPYGFNEPASTADELVQRTWERIPYRPMPTGVEQKKITVWMSWAAINLLHMLSRLAVLDDTMIAHGYHHLAWPMGRPFNDWWNTSALMVRAYSDGLYEPRYHQRILEGLPEALMRQSAHFRDLRSK